MREDYQEKHESWKVILSDWESSGRTAAAYCRDAGIAIWKFYYWKKRLRSNPETGSSGFVELSFAVSGNDSGIRLELPGGIRILLERGFDAVELKRTVMSLQG